MKSKRAVIYVRVSTSNKASNGEGFEQNPEVQEPPLRQMIAQRGWKLYSGRMSGAKENRPGLNGLMQAVRRGEFDAVIVWRFDRFARSTKIHFAGRRGRALPLHLKNVHLPGLLINRFLTSANLSSIASVAVFSLSTPELATRFRMPPGRTSGFGVSSPRMRIYRRYKASAIQY